MLACVPVLFWCRSFSYPFIWRAFGIPEILTWMGYLSRSHLYCYDELANGLGHYLSSGIWSGLTYRSALASPYLRSIWSLVLSNAKLYRLPRSSNALYIHPVAPSPLYLILSIRKGGLGWIKWLQTDHLWQHSNENAFTVGVENRFEEGSK